MGGLWGTAPSPSHANVGQSVVISPVWVPCSRLQCGACYACAIQPRRLAKYGSSLPFPDLLRVIMSMQLTGSLLHTPCKQSSIIALFVVQ